MGKEYSEEIKHLLVKQYKKLKEEYEHVLAKTKNMVKKAEEDLEIEWRHLSGISLHPESVSFDSKCRTKHHTDKFEVGDGKNSTPIYRRGESFKMIVTFNRKYNPKHDSVFLIVSFGPNASINKGTKYTLPLLPTKPIKNVDQWAVWIEEQSEKSLTLEIFTPTTCLVGIWRFKYSISSAHSHSAEEETISTENIFYILFNPWCEGDEVYMKEEVDREAYVIADYGNIYQGTYKEPTAKNWVYGQFDFSVLPSIFLLLERSTYPASVRGSAAIMVRALSAVINANDDHGLLIGNWAPEIRDGTHPEEWIGSVSIFDEFLSEGGDQPVKYAQCWVFAGCLTTACRAVGIPCRSVTCFQAAHVADGSLTVSYYLDKNGKEISKENSIWNYHVWNEVWMERKDLPAEYNGWQAADATPQEKSKGIFRVGPTSVKAVCNADLGLNYDVPFVFSEVNADVCYFQTDHKSSWGYRLVYRKQHEVGTMIATDSFRPEHFPHGQAYMEILNGNYKYQEGSIKEREMFNRAINQMPKAQVLYERIGSFHQNKQDVDFTTEKINSLVFGEKFSVSVILQNHSSQTRTVEVQLKAQVSLYTGSYVALIKEEKKEVILQPTETMQLTVPVSADDYMNKLGTASHIKQTVVGTVLETDQFFAADDTFEVTRPTLEVRAPQFIQLTTPFPVTFFFKNLYPEELKNCTLTVEAGKVQRPTVMEIGNVPVNGVMEKTIQLMSKHVGRSVIAGILKSKDISVKGSIYIEVHY